MSQDLMKGFLHALLVILGLAVTARILGLVAATYALMGAWRALKAIAASVLLATFFFIWAVIPGGVRYLLAVQRHGGTDTLSVQRDASIPCIECCELALVRPRFPPASER